MKRGLLIPSILLISYLEPSSLTAGPLEGGGMDPSYQEVIRTVHQAAHEVDDA